MDCLFCKIAKGEIPSSVVYEDDSVLAFNDIDPKAPVHILLIPKNHADSVMDMDEHADADIAAMFATARKIVKDLELDKKGFRLVVNTGDDGGQTVQHLHMHLLGGRQMAWPPG